MNARLLLMAMGRKHAHAERVETAMTAWRLAWTAIKT